MSITYWVSWTCDGYDFDAHYATREERDARAAMLRAEEAEGLAELRRVAYVDPFASDIETWEVLPQALADDELIGHLRSNGFGHPRANDGAGSKTSLTRSNLTKIGHMWLDLRLVDATEYEAWLLLHPEADTDQPVAHCTYRQGDDVLFAQVMTLSKMQDLVGTFLNQ